MRDLGTILIENIRAKLDARSWSQTELAERAGLNRVLTNKYLTGKSSPGLEALAKIAEALDTDPAELLKEPNAQERRLSAGRRALIELARTLPESLLSAGLLALRGLAAGAAERRRIAKKPG